MEKNTPQEKSEEFDLVDALNKAMSGDNEGNSEQEEQPETRKENVDIDEVEPKNRAERRALEQLRKERKWYEEANQKLASEQQQLSEKLARMEGMQEILKNNPELSPEELQIFGNTEDGKAIKNYLENRFKSVEEAALEKARQEWEAREQQNAQAEQEETQYVENSLNSIEDQYNVDLSGDTKASRELRNGFLDFVEQISPKDQNGEITEYADFNSAFSTYQRLNGKSKSSEMSQRQKEIADRSMTNSEGNSPSDPSQRQRVTFDFLERMK